MKRIAAFGLAAVAWMGVGFCPTHAQGTRGVMIAAAQNPNSTRDDRAVANGAGTPGGTGKRPMTFADLMAMKRVSDPQISPSGKWVLFTVMDVDLEKNTKTNHLWVAPLGGGLDSSASLPNDETNAGVPRLRPSGSARDDGSMGGERQVTSGAGESFGRFSPDGTRVSWTEEPGKDETFARIAVAAWDEKTGTVGEAKLLTGVSGDADGAVWSPDSKRLMFTTEVWPECSVVGGATPTSQNRDVGHPNTNAGVPPLRPSASGRDDGERRDAGPSTASGASAPDFAQDDTAVEGVEIGGTNNVAAWRGMQPAAWADEDACDKAKDEAADRNPVKAQVWDGLLYRHWDHWTGAKRTHILVADLVPTHDDTAVVNGGSGKTNAGVPRLRPSGSARDDGSMGTSPPVVTAIRDVTTARDVGDAETPTWFLGGPQEYAWAPDSKEIAYVTNLDPVPAASTSNSVLTLRVDEPDAKPVKVSTSLGSDDEPEYSPDGKYLAFRSQRQAGFESDQFRLMLFDRAKRTMRDLMPKFIGWVDEFTWAGSDGIDIVAGYHGEEDILGIGVLSNEDAKPRYPAFLAYGADFSDVSFGIEASKPGTLNLAPAFIVAVKMKANEPAEVVKVHLCDCVALSPPNEIGIAGSNGSSVTQLTHLNDSLLSQLDLNPIEPFWFTGAEGTKVEGFLLKPPGFDPKKKYPLKFIMHGGPQTMAGDNWSYRWNWELMAASGYVVIGINRRGSTGYGQKFVDEVSGDWGGRAYEDLMKGLDYAEAHYPFIDKTRECALGASYGGYMADWVLTHTNRFKCIVTHDGLYDAGAAWGSTEEMWFPEWEFRRPEDFPRGWDGFSSGYDPMGHLKANAGIPPLRASRSGRDDGGDSNGANPPKQSLGGAPGESSGGTPTSLRDVGHPNPTHAQSTRVNGAPRDDGKRQRRSPLGMTNNGETGEGHAAEPWRYAGLPANEDPFRRWSPKEFIQNARTPTLVIHSQKDYRLDVSQGFELYTALQRMGVPSRFLYFPDEGHWVLKPRNAELWNAAVSDWCDRWTHTGKYAESK